MKTSPDNFEGTCGDYTQVSNCINYFLPYRWRDGKKYICHKPKGTPYATPFRRRFFAYHHAVNYYLSMIVLKCATNGLKIGLQIKI